VDVGFAVVGGFEIVSKWVDVVKQFGGVHRARGRCPATDLTWLALGRTLLQRKEAQAKLYDLRDIEQDIISD
jgi:hypothetical protein